MRKILGGPWPPIVLKKLRHCFDIEREIKESNCYRRIKHPRKVICTYLSLTYFNILSLSLSSSLLFFHFFLFFHNFFFQLCEWVFNWTYLKVCTNNTPQHLGNILLYGSCSPKCLALSNAKRRWCALLCLWMSIMIIFSPNSLFSLVSLTCLEKLLI